MCLTDPTDPIDLTDLIDTFDLQFFCHCDLFNALTWDTQSKFQKNETGNSIYNFAIFLVLWSWGEGIFVLQM